MKKVLKLVILKFLIEYRKKSKALTIASFSNVVRKKKKIKNLAPKRRYCNEHAIHFCSNFKNEMNNLRSMNLVVVQKTISTKTCSNGETVEN